MNKTFVTSTLLSVIYEKTGKDYLALLLPFVEYILEKDFVVDQELDIEKIRDALSTDFMFVDMPHNVVNTILNRIKKKKKITKKNQKLYLSHDYSGQVGNFIEKRKTIDNILTNSINKMMTYVNNDLGTEYSYSEIEHQFSRFLTDYGYKTLFDHSAFTLIPSKKESINYVIGKYIELLSKDRTSPDFIDIMHILKGQMLTDAIYLQVDSKNKKHLQNLNVYIDGPLMLRFLGLKSEYENLAAKELLNVLKVNKTKLKIFQHTRDEIANILTAYSNRINEPKYSTIEKFDSLRYSKEQVKIYINELDRTIRELEFEIIEKPDFDEKYLIDEQKLTEKLLQAKTKVNYNSQYAVERDVLSVRSLNILRRGVNYQTIEDCNHIFITSYHYLKLVSDSIRDDSHTHIIGSVLTDLELATILWIKNASLNDELPKMKLMEIAMAAQEPSNELIDKTMSVINQIKEDENFDDDKFGSRLTYQYLNEKNINEQVKNDSTLITRELIEQVILKDSKEIEQSKIAIRDMENKIRLNERAQFKLIEDNGDKVYKIWNKSLNYIYYFMTIVFIATVLGLQFSRIFGLQVWQLIIVIIIMLLPHIWDIFKRDKSIKKLIIRFAKAKKLSFIQKQQTKLEFIRKNNKEK